MMRTILFRFCVLVLGGALGWLALASAIGMAFATTAPDLARSWWPFGATTASAQAAAITFEHDDKQAAARARTLAIAALRSEPANAGAVRSLALASGVLGDERRARALMTYGETLSRRDVLIEMWWIEADVAKGDVVGALRHYDRVMRTSIDMRPTLIPVLVQASQSGAVSLELAKVVAQRPNWTPALLDTMISQGRSAEGLDRVIRAAGLNVALPQDAIRLSGALRRIVDLGEIDRAFALYRFSVGSSAGGATAIRNGDFESDRDIPPFGWRYADLADLAAIREPVNGAEGRFALLLTGKAAGEAARQLLVLKPGTYRLKARVGRTMGSDVGRPSLSVSCADAASTVLARQLFPVAADTAQIAFDVTVPPACSGQWLVIATGANVDQATDPPWIDSLAIVQH